MILGEAIFRYTVLPELQGSGMMRRAKLADQFHILTSLHYSFFILDLYFCHLMNSATCS